MKRTTIYDYLGLIFFGGKVEYLTPAEAREMATELLENAAIIEAAQQGVQLTAAGVESDGDGNSAIVN